MNSYFDLLVLAALFVPVLLIVAGNLAAYRSPDAGDGLAGLPVPDPLPAPLPELAARPMAAAETPGAMPELREAA